MHDDKLDAHADDKPRMGEEPASLICTQR